MKTLKILAVLLFATTVAVAQDINEKDVPAAVKNAFAKEYANASDVEWEKRVDTYKVEFDQDRMEHEIWYNSSGTVVRKEQEIAQADLPQPVRDAINSKYPDYRLDDIDKDWENNKTTYTVELEKGNEEIHVTFSADGKIMSERKD